METTKYKYRLVARITLEAISPLAVGSGDKDIITDAPVARDVNGMPYIPGPSLAGVIRHSLDDKPYAKELFGYQDGEKGQGSRLIISDALIVGEDGRAVDGLRDIFQSNYLKNFLTLPIRQHVRINSKGSAKEHGKFDEEVVFAGTRFCFEMEMLAESENNSTQMQDILQTLSAPTFRLGSGTRNGFGSMKPVRIQYAAYDLTKQKELEAYAAKSACINDDWKAPVKKDIQVTCPKGWTKYVLRLKPCDFMLFSSGFGDDEADITPVKEQHVIWNGMVPDMSEEYFLVPATSVKGAVAHRTAYHWSRFNQLYADEGKAVECEKNPAVIDIFGTDTETSEIKPKRGNAIFSDVMVKDTGEKVVYHIKVDKFTGGVQDGALFQEKVANVQGREIMEEILVDNKVFEKDPTVREAFEKALQDICNGLLCLGGGTNRGNGMFTGTLTKEE